MKMLTVFFLVVCFCVGCQKYDSQQISFMSVESADGHIQGAQHDDVISFRGIPYAKAPVGELRWRAPQHLEKRNETLIADTFGKRCYQNPQSKTLMGSTESFTQGESEDCLYLNLYRPNSDVSGLPVLFWIHGGGLTAGSGSRPINQGEQLARQGIIVVSFNYRLGTFGFFAHPELSQNNPDPVTYNYGLLDQIAALKWVYENITSFGGDASKITIAGESAGAASVNALLASPLTEGMIAAAISQSGYTRDEHPRIAVLAKDEKSIETMGAAFAQRAGFSSASMDDLRGMSSEQVVAATDYVTYITFAIDGYSLKENVYTTFENGRQHKVPLMIGSTDFEFGMVPPLIQRNLMKPYFSEDVFQGLATLYGSAAARDTLLYSDYIFHSQARAIASQHKRLGQPVFMYRFGVPSLGVQLPEFEGYDINGAYHAGELPYMFGNFTGDHKEPIPPSKEQIAVSDAMILYWSNFVKTGNPNGEGLELWREFDGKSVFSISETGLETIPDAWAQRLDTLNAIIGDLNSYLDEPSGPDAL